MDYVISVVVAFIVVICIIPFIKKFAKKYNFLDFPKDPRKIHSRPIPILGGLAIYLAIIITYFLAYQTSILEFVGSPIFIATTLILLLGMYDDRFDMPAKYKLIFQIIIATI